MDKKKSEASRRQNAEELIKKRNIREHDNLSEADTLRLIHELQVHQIELEMQNDELRQVKEELQKKNDDLERFNKLAIGRELVMIELKKKIKALEEKNPEVI